jgi:phosphoribosylaminoimidazolecarboxamide formyltransferase / IMP cyclohydrolase
MPDKLRSIARALISVSDKTKLVEFARELAARSIEIVSTEGTRKALAAAGITAKDVADLTGFPEMMDGRVKTLHPSVHGGLLALRENPEHEAAMLVHGIAPIDLLVVNLYPFEATVAEDAGFADCIEKIDVGGPAMIRAAAKNFDSVTVIVDVEDYDLLLVELAENDGATRLAFRRNLAQKAFARTAAYDTGISNWLAAEIGEAAPAYRSFAGHRIETLRYGENPHQSAAFYRMAQRAPSIAAARQLQGKQLSYNNVGDADAALDLIAEFDPSHRAAVAIIKHANPCGVAQAASLSEAYRLALRCDPISAYGAIVAVNRRLDAETTQEMVKIFIEVIIAPEADEDAIAIIARKQNLRLLVTGALPDPRRADLTFRSVSGGFLVQSRDNAVVGDMDLRVVTKRAPSEAELDDLTFAFRVAKYVKANAIVYAKGGATVGIGAGQMSRVDSSRIAAQKAEEAARAAGLAESLARGSVVASDAFFPFADGLIAAVEAGATAVIQPGGSLRDEEVIKAADDAGLAMVFTGVRHFRH